MTKGNNRQCKRHSPDSSTATLSSNALRLELLSIGSYGYALGLGETGGAEVECQCYYALNCEML